jgi:hypothetical protein
MRESESLRADEEGRLSVPCPASEMTSISADDAAPVNDLDET